MGRELRPGLPPEGEGGWRAMAGRADNSAGGDDVVRAGPAAWQPSDGCVQANGLPRIPDCIAIALIPQARAALQRLRVRV